MNFKAMLILFMLLLMMGGTMSAQEIPTQVDRLRELDFSPFEEALADFSPERASEIEFLPPPPPAQ